MEYFWNLAREVYVCACIFFAIFSQILTLDEDKNILRLSSLNDYNNSVRKNGGCSRPCEVHRFRFAIERRSIWHVSTRERVVQLVSIVLIVHVSKIESQFGGVEKIFGYNFCDDSLWLCECTLIVLALYENEENCNVGRGGGGGGRRGWGRGGH